MGFDSSDFIQTKFFLQLLILFGFKLNWIEKRYKITEFIKTETYKRQTYESIIFNKWKKNIYANHGIDFTKYVYADKLQVVQKRKIRLYDEVSHKTTAKNEVNLEYLTK